MQNENEISKIYKKVLQTLDFEILFWKNLYDTLVFESLKNNLYSYLTDLKNFWSIVLLLQWNKIRFLEHFLIFYLNYAKS